MSDLGYLQDLEKCTLCEHKCGVNRLKKKTGVCKVTLPIVASTTLHPAPPESYTVFMAGCNFKCLNCHNWTISQYPDNGYEQRGYEDPKGLAKECIEMLESPSARLMRADRIFFSGGEPTIHLPYIEKVVEEARRIRPDTKVNFDSNGYMTEESLERILSFATSITYDIKAYSDEVHLALTGASSKPVLRNAEYVGRYARDKLWEYRILVIPAVNEDEIRPLMEFIAGIDPSLPVCFLAFRPNFVLENHLGAGTNIMDKCFKIARDSGLEDVYWSGQTGLAGKIIKVEKVMDKSYFSASAKLLATYAFNAGCQNHPRGCSACGSNQRCSIKRYIPKRVT